MLQIRMADLFGRIQMDSDLFGQILIKKEPDPASTDLSEIKNLSNFHIQKLKKISQKIAYFFVKLFFFKGAYSSFVVEGF